MPTNREVLWLVLGFWKGARKWGVDLDDEIAALDRLLEQEEIDDEALRPIVDSATAKMRDALLAARAAVLALEAEDAPPGPVH